MIKRPTCLMIVFEDLNMEECMHEFHSIHIEPIAAFHESSVNRHAETCLLELDCKHLWWSIFNLSFHSTPIHCSLEFSPS